MIRFFVPGNPVPKQSFFYTKNGGGFTDPRMKAWQNTVILYATRNVDEMITGDVHAHLSFFLPDHHRRDCDNLSKAVLDGLNGIAFEDDKNITRLVIEKQVNKEKPGVLVELYQANEW